MTTGVWPKGYDVFEVNGHLELQADDEVGVYDNDHDAVIAAINDTMDGDMDTAAMLQRVLLNEGETDNA